VNHLTQDQFSSRVVEFQDSPVDAQRNLIVVLADDAKPAAIFAASWQDATVFAVFVSPLVSTSCTDASD
jgi:hypothetical protein